VNHRSGLGHGSTGPAELVAAPGCARGHDVIALAGAIEATRGVAGMTRRAAILPDGRFVTDGDSFTFMRRAISAVRDGYAGWHTVGGEGAEQSFGAKT
jgi:hypothetical protein